MIEEHTNLVLEWKDLDQESLLALEDVLNERSSMVSTSGENAIVRDQQKDLADKCLFVRERIFDYVSEELKGKEYRGMSNQEFSDLKNSKLTSYLYIALYMAECRGRLTAYLLSEKRK